MDAVRINGFVGKDGLKIGIDQLSAFKNQNVEIIILPANNKNHDTKKTHFFNAVGSIIIDEKEIESLRNASII